MSLKKERGREKEKEREKKFRSSGTSAAGPYRTQELWESRGDRLGLAIPKATLNSKNSRTSVAVDSQPKWWDVGGAGRGVGVGGVGRSVKGKGGTYYVRGTRDCGIHARNRMEAV